MIMSRKGFKQFANALTKNQYYYLEKPIFILSSAILQIYMILKWQPITDVFYEGFTSKVMYIASLFFVCMGVYMMVKSKEDQSMTP